MLTEQDLQLLGQLIDTKLDQKLDQKLAPINQRLDRLESKVDQIAEDVSINRAALDSLIEWADRVGNAINFPLPKL